MQDTMFISSWMGYKPGLKGSLPTTIIIILIVIIIYHQALSLKGIFQKIETGKVVSNSRSRVLWGLINTFAESCWDVRQAKLSATDKLSDFHFWSKVEPGAATANPIWLTWWKCQSHPSQYCTEKLTRKDWSCQIGDFLKEDEDWVISNP